LEDGENLCGFAESGKMTQKKRHHCCHHRYSFPMRQYIHVKHAWRMRKNSAVSLKAANGAKETAPLPSSSLFISYEAMP
jgi:hypothetical protein